jgi:hypothetical protein
LSIFGSSAGCGPDGPEHAVKSPANVSVMKAWWRDCFIKT